MASALLLVAEALGGWPVWGVLEVVGGGGAELGVSGSADWVEGPLDCHELRPVLGSEVICSASLGLCWYMAVVTRCT